MPRKGTIWALIGMLAVVSIGLVSVVVLAPKAPGPGTLASSDPAITYVGPWTDSDTTEGPERVSLGTADALFTFDGVGFAWFGTAGDAGRQATVYIDGVAVASVDEPASTEAGGVERLFSSPILSAGRHTVRIAASGSDEKGPGVQRLEIYATKPPAEVTDVEASRDVAGVDLSWRPDASTHVHFYRIYRSSGPARDFDLLSTVSKDTTSYRDSDALGASSTPRYYVVAVDAAGRESPTSSIATTSIIQPAVPKYEKLADCPAATAEVDDARQLRSALRSAGPGTVIRLADGVYKGQFELSARGTAEEPIWICGSKDAILRGASMNSGYGLHIVDSSYVFATGFTVTNSKKGIMLDRSSHISLTQLAVRQIGNEGVHFRSKTTDSLLAGSSISATGRQTKPARPQWGEGVYVGSHASNWCSFGYEGCVPDCAKTSDGCEPDRSDRNVIADNRIFDTTAESVDIKEGAENGLVIGNKMNADSSTSTERWLVVRSNGWYITDNDGSSDRGGNGIQIYPPPTPGYGTGNVVSGNTADFDGSSADSVGYAVRIQNKGNIVTCDNSSRGGDGNPAINVSCEGP
ncbi:hypothetical protein [Brevibacterium sediminis]|uniref:hypothetical protein n=1 Tax=Brevibacterium sediminis TaxID=1857024 RepID=UPI003B3A2514